MEIDCRALFDIVESQQILLSNSPTSEDIKACLRDLHLEIYSLAHTLNDKVEDAIQIASI